MPKLNKLPFFRPAVIGLDIETTGLDRFRDRIIAIGLSDGKETWILTENFERVCAILEDPNCLKVIQNADFDLTFLAYNLGCKPVNIYDTLIVERIINNGLPISNELDQILARRLHVLLDKEIRDTFIDFEGELTDEQLSYIENDCKYLPALREHQQKDIKERHLEKIVELENRCILPVLDMTLTGVGLDVDEFWAAREKIHAVLEQNRQEIANVLGIDFYVDVQRAKGIERIDIMDVNFGSWQQTLPLLHKIGIKAKNTQRETLERYEDKHPFVPLLMEHKKWKDMLRWHWPDFILEETKRIHPKWNQTGTITARFSSEDPNMQQIERPKKDHPEYPNFRALFKPLPNHTLICADYSQQEPRILAHLSGDERMIAAANFSDIYIAFAKDVWNEIITREDPKRHRMKEGVLASLYGIWWKSLAPKMRVSEQVAEQTQNKIFSTYPKAYQWGNNSVRKVVQWGYVTTAWGRRIYWDKVPKNMMWKIKKEARNYPVQGTGADMLKLAMCNIYDIIQEIGFDAHLMIALHDELVYSVHKDQAEEFYPVVITEMEKAGQTICPSVKFIAEGRITDIWTH